MVEEERPAKQARLADEGANVIIQFESTEGDLAGAVQEFISMEWHLLCIRSQQHVLGSQDTQKQRCRLAAAERLAHCVHVLTPHTHGADVIHVVLCKQGRS
jgi:hypothetical protein